jgi:UDP-N-acetyl-D-glucosamine dehydrogenase
MNNISIIGLGYVGLPLAIAAIEIGNTVSGIDSDPNKIDQLKKSRSSIEDVSNESLANTFNTGRFTVSSDYSSIKHSNIVIICVPTPLLNKKPDLSNVIKSAVEISKYIQKNTLVILESTVQPGTTRDVLLSTLIKNTGFKHEEIYVAFSPERIDPLNKVWKLKNTPKIVAGLTKKAQILAVEFYSSIIEEIVECDVVEVAETAKLLENSFRFINISFINELSVFCNKIGIEINDVIDAASTKPYGFMPFFPGIGIGGHCIPVDPLYLSAKAREVGVTAKFIELADEINMDIPLYFAEIAKNKIGELKSKKIVIVGVSFKPNISDTRETPVLKLIQILKNKGAEVYWHDDLVKEWNGEKSTLLSDKFDLAIIAVQHDYLDLTKLGKVPIINSRSSI